MKYIENTNFIDFPDSKSVLALAFYKQKVKDDHQMLPDETFEFLLFDNKIIFVTNNSSYGFYKMENSNELLKFIKKETSTITIK